MDKLAFYQEFQVLYDVTLELSRASSVEDLCRRAVLLTKDKLGFSRVGIWLYSTTEPEKIFGTFGTDSNGRLCDERHSVLDLNLHTHFHELSRHLKDIAMESGVPLFDCRLEPVGTGDRIWATLWDGERVIGIISVDNLLDAKPYDESDAQRIKLFSAILGPLYSRIRAEDALRKSEENYRILIEAQTDLVIKLDLDGRFLFVSPSFCRTFGKSEADLLGEKYILFVHEEDRQKTLQSIESLRNPPHACYVELRAMTADGWRWLAWSGTAILGENGEAQAFIGVGRDISSRKDMEETLRQAQKMEAVGQLAGGIAHDFNNQLTVVKGYCDLLLKNIDPDNSMYAQIEEIRKAANRAASLTSQLLAFSRKQILRPQVLNLNLLITNAAELLQRLIGEDIQLVLTQQPDLGFVKIDPILFQQALMNMAANSRDAMPDGGTLALETSSVEIDLQYLRQHHDASTGPHVLLEVRDSGEGMSPDVVEHVFEPFFTTKPIDKGTGLGLAMVYGFVHQSGGHITVNSRPDKGTSFKIYLPRVEDAPEMSIQEIASQEEFRGNETILVAEDDESVRRLVVRFLRQQGYTVLETANALEAQPLGEHYAEPIHLLITDVIMPHMSGPELVSRLRKVRPDLPVLYITGYTEQNPIAPEPRKGDIQMITKPFSPNKLGETVRRLLDQFPLDRK